MPELYDHQPDRKATAKSKLLIGLAMLLTLILFGIVGLVVAASVIAIGVGVKKMVAARRLSE